VIRLQIQLHSEPIRIKEFFRGSLANSMKLSAVEVVLLFSFPQQGQIPKAQPHEVEEALFR
jgi:hypothetical protein